MTLWENQERFYTVPSLERAKQIVAGFDEAMAVVDCDPQTYRLYDGETLIWERPGYRVP